jgi:hypothetical protein
MQQRQPAARVEPNWVIVIAEREKWSLGLHELALGGAGSNSRSKVL